MTEESDLLSGPPAPSARSRFLKPEWARPVYTLAAVVVGSVLYIVFSILTFVWLAAYATVLSTAGRLLRASRLYRAVDAVSGTVLIGLGVKVAADAR